MLEERWRNRRAAMEERREKSAKNERGEVSLLDSRQEM